MGLTAKSTGTGAIDKGINIERTGNEFVIALAGNPNVGKSTVFNGLTGLNQHTGNWPGKTVTIATGDYTHKEKKFVLVDIPGTYSLMSNSQEEEVARDFVCFGEPDAVVVVCDATCLERNLNLVLQTIEITPKTVVCVNLLDEAKKKKIKIDIQKLEEKLGVPVVGCTASKGEGLEELMDRVLEVCEKAPENPVKIEYEETIETVINTLEETVKNYTNDMINSRWVAIKLIKPDEKLVNSISTFIAIDLNKEQPLIEKYDIANEMLNSAGLDIDDIENRIVASIVTKGEEIAKECVSFEKKDYLERDRKLDKVLTNRIIGVPIMIIALGIVLWITITGANVPSALLSKGLFWIGDRMTDGLNALNAPEWVNGILVLGVYRVLAWVVSVMLPPMAIFFPLFTLLEDLGYLPRIAFNLDKHFKKACACGKQSLTMCMGLGCNAAGVIGCRIIDSPRERLIATITNNFVPCNGRFPTLIAIISMFFIGASIGFGSSVLSAVLLTGVIVLGVIMTFITSKFLSKTFLKGQPSSFTLELPPYRKPQIGKIIVRSILDRTLFVLGRACVVAAPVGLVIWLMSNIVVGDMSVLAHCSNFLDPFGRFLGLDGVILLAFILGLPANEIVVPIIIMAYMAEGKILELDLPELKTLLVDNGWTWITAISVMLFSLMHWPCSTTLLTIKKETQSLKWTLVSFLVPTVCGIIICAVFANVARLFV